MKIRRGKLLLGTVFAFVAMFFCAINVQARCTDQQLFELQEAGRRVRSTIEIVEGTQMREVGCDETAEFVMVEFPTIEFRIDTFNITSDIFVTMTNNLTREVITIHEGMLENGVFSYITDEMENIVNYSFSVMTSADGCFGQQLRTYTVRKPMMNDFSLFSMCEGMDEIPYCRKFLDAPLNISEDELADRIQRFLSGPESESEDPGVIEWLRDNTLIIVVVIIVIAGVAGASIVIAKKRRESL